MRCALAHTTGVLLDLDQVRVLRQSLLLLRCGQHDVQDAILATAGSSEAASDAASDAAAEPDTQNLDEPAADSTAADSTAAEADAADNGAASTAA